MKRKANIWVFISLGLCIILAVSLFFILAQRKEMNDIKTQIAIEEEKRNLEAEYANLAFEYDRFEGSKMLINNDSLINQLENEKLKVQRLQEELKTTKNIDAKRINELKKELATLRSVMRAYVIQIDSLNALNQKLTAENREVSNKYREATETATQLQKDKEELTQKVSLASKLDAIGISINTLNSKGKNTNRISKIEYIEVNFSIAKNVTAQPGERYVYLRIIKPDNDVLIKNRNDLFVYEDSEINYSAKKLVEYDSEETPVTLYWTVEEYLYPGVYRMELFADNEKIGEKSITLQK
ncbi:MAG: hypothetical protein IAC54_02395 [Bacteroidetes bacterium]|uniref:Chromosome segregation protein SMC n=1 Tax=Candidatus Caccoplasma merdipullorum TaxID=2840718 RepID=A0A9D9E275_9BACT|nr:hypothetical protein [Candidatus Caccoplasma merdipullorum]